jgi:rhodanese-related sulfurtransferase
MGANQQFTNEIDLLQAWQWHQEGLGQIIDVRTIEELRFVGRVDAPGIHHVPWALGVQLQPNQGFLDSLLAVAPQKTTPLLFLCRSGKRSLAAVNAARSAGYEQVFSILEGFEGDLSEAGRRGEQGWRARGLPWVQS